MFVNIQSCVKAALEQPEHIIVVTDSNAKIVLVQINKVLSFIDHPTFFLIFWVLILVYTIKQLVNCSFCVLCEYLLYCVFNKIKMSVLQINTIFLILLYIQKGICMEDVELRVGVVPFSYLPYSDFTNLDQWNGFYGELLTQLQEKTSIRFIWKQAQFLPLFSFVDLIFH